MCSHTSNVVIRQYGCPFYTDKAEEERSYNGVIAKDERRMIVFCVLKITNNRRIVWRNGK